MNELDKNLWHLFGGYLSEGHDLKYLKILAFKAKVSHISDNRATEVFLIWITVIARAECKNKLTSVKCLSWWSKRPLAKMTSKKGSLWDTGFWNTKGANEALVSVNWDFHWVGTSVVTPHVLTTLPWFDIYMSKHFSLRHLMGHFPSQYDRTVPSCLPTSPNISSLWGIFFF